MNFLRKSCCLLRRDGIFYPGLHSCRFICNLNKRFVDSEGQFVNKLLLWTSRPRSGPSSRSQPRSTCISSSIPGLGLGQVNPKNCEQIRWSSSVTDEESQNQDSITKLNKYLKTLECNIQRGFAVSKVGVDNIILKMRTVSEHSGDQLLMQDAGLLLLQGCGDLMCSEVTAVRLELAHHIVTTLQQLGASMTVHHYNALLKCYVENRHLIETSKFLKEMTASPNEETYHLLLWCIGNLEQALDLIQGMKEKGFPVSEPVFNALVYGHARTGDFASAQSVLETMQSAQLQPSSHTYTALLRGLAECGDVEQMQKTFQEATGVNAALSQNQILSVIKSLATSGHATSIQSVLPWVPELDGEDANTLKNMLKHFVHLELDDTVTLLIGKLPVEESPPFGKFLLKEMVKANRSVQSILSLCDFLSEPNPMALSQATLAALWPPKTDLALKLFEATKESEAPLRAHYYWPLLIAAREQGEEQLFKVLHHMRQMDVPMDSITMSTYVLRFVSLEAPTALLRRFQDLGFTLTEVFALVLVALISNGRLDMARELCESYPIRVECEQLVRPLATALLKGAELASVIELVKALIQSSHQSDDWVGRLMVEVFTNPRLSLKPDRWEIVVKGLSDAGLRCSSHVAELISSQISSPQGNGKSRLFEILTGMVDPEQTISSPDTLNFYMRHPRHMELNELESHLGELQAKKMNTRGVLRLLLLKYCQLGQLNNVKKTKQELTKAGHKFSLGMKAALFDFYVKMSQLDEAKSSFHELSQDSSFKLDEHKVINYAMLLVTHNQTKEAFSVLEERSTRGIQGGPELSRNCQKLLASTSQHGQPQDTQLMLDGLVEFGYCTISNKMLGPLIKTYLLRNDIEGAVKEFRTCVARYQFSPLMYELLCCLIREAVSKAPGGKVSPNRAKELLEDIMTSIRKLHGYVNTRVSFVMALADMGETEWLTQFFKESGKNIDSTGLVRRCQRLVDEDKPEAIQNLIAAIRDTKLFNVASLFFLLLQVHCRRGDTKAALDMWTTMQETGCSPSPQFLNMFTSFLESNKIEVPCSVPVAGLDVRQKSANTSNPVG